MCPRKLGNKLLGALHKGLGIQEKGRERKRGDISKIKEKT